jgi:hypothetical protein
MLYFLFIAEMWEKISFNKRAETRDWESNWMLEPNRGTNLPFGE